MQQQLSTARRKLLEPDTSSRTMAEAQARADALFFSIGVGAIATDKNGHIYRINDIALKILGYKKEEVIDHWFPEIVKAVDENGFDVSIMKRPIARALLSGTAISDKTYYRTKSGSRVPVSITVSPILHEGRPIGAVEVFHDSSLEDEIDRMKSEFISIASHQLRTPLSAINTYASMLGAGYAGELNANQQAYVDIIQTAAERMNNLISTLLDISKLEAGALNVRVKQTEIPDLLNKTIDELKEVARQKHIELRVACSDPNFQAECDPLLLGEVYANLISNAIKYTPEGGEVSVKLAFTDTEAVFSVRDTGYGIPEHLQNKIFTKFFRASNIQRQDTTGTGLGLYMVKQISDAMGGRVSFTSKENKGSTFCFALPLETTSST
jgi:PAS domain S-box-containing protein